MNAEMTYDETVKIELAKIGAREIRPRTFEINGKSGIYTVESRSPEMMNPEITTWSCTCPSYQHRGGMCKHATAIASVMNNVADEFGYE
jgi:hypothetical protein